MVMWFSNALVCLCGSMHCLYLWRRRGSWVIVSGSGVGSCCRHVFVGLGWCHNRCRILREWGNYRSVGRHRSVARRLVVGSGEGWSLCVHRITLRLAWRFGSLCVAAVLGSW